MSLSSPDARSARSVHALTRILGMATETVAVAVGVPPEVLGGIEKGAVEPTAKQREALDSLLTNSLAGAAEADRLRAVLAKLHMRYGSPRLGNQDDPLDELFYILLSLKTSYLTYEETYEHFKSGFYPWHKLLDAQSEQVEAYIKRGGLGSLKAKAFIDIARRLKDDFGDVTLQSLKAMPTEEAEGYLMSLPAVGRKTARCVLMYALARDTTPVDTHTYRVGVRLGVVPTSRNTNHVHANFDKIIPSGLAYCLHTNFVALGRAICQDPSPKCEVCPVRELCLYGQSQLAAGDVTEATQARAAAPPRLLAPEDKIRAVDIYAGCGGLSAGLSDAGFTVGYSLDWDAHACATHRHNFPECTVECVDVRKVAATQIEEAVGGRVDVVAGGPNCQGVSQRGLRNPDDPRNFMFPEFVRLVSELRPTAFIMENVAGLAHRHNYQLLQTVFASFQDLGYRCAADVLLAANYGVPQLRYRFFLIGTLLPDMPLNFPLPTHEPNGERSLFAQPFVTVGQAIGDLPVIDASRQVDVALPYAVPVPQNDFQRYAREGSEMVYNHTCSATSEINLNRASFVPEGGNWKDIPCELLPDRFFGCRMTDHSTTYARLRRDQPSYTVTALFGNITAGAFTHPTSNRALSIREGARLQSFRDNFVFQGPRNSQYRQIGNAVPPLLAKAVGEHLAKLLRGESVSGSRPRINEQTLADKRSWDALPVLTPRYKEMFGHGTRWPSGWGEEPEVFSAKLDGNYTLRPEFRPRDAIVSRRNLLKRDEGNVAGE